MNMDRNGLKGLKMKKILDSKLISPFQVFFLQNSPFSFPYLCIFLITRVMPNEVSFDQLKGEKKRGQSFYGKSIRAKIIFPCKSF